LSPVTAGGGLPASPFSLATDDDVEAILAEIPFFSVGILAFAVFTFFLALKRVNLLATYLFVSAFTAFLAAILDLNDILSQRHSVLGLSTASSNPLTIFRDIFFSISVGIRFFFFWTFVATRPRAEPSTQIQHSTSIFARHEGYHSAAWSRWAVPGMVLKWGLLLMTVLILALQIAWRIKGNGGPIYFAEATLEIVASVLFILKLLMNTWLSTTTPIITMLKYYAAPIVVLMLGIGIAIGNLASFEFSETTLGRFLQAVGLYILLLFLLISTFSKQRSYPVLLDAPLQPPVKPDYADKSFRGLSDWQTRQSVFHVTPPTISSPEEPSISNHDTIQTQSRRLSSRNSNRFSDVGSKLSAWKFKKPNARRMNPDPLRVINLDDPERGYSMEKGRAVSLTSIEEPNTALPYLAVEAPTPEPKQVLKSQWISNTLGQNPSASKSTNTVVESQAPGSSIIQGRRPYETSSIVSYYATARLSSSTIRPKPDGIGASAEEPVYGLDGIQPPSPATIRPDRPRSSVVSFNEMMRQQQELDDSIAALRLLTPGDSTPVPSTDSSSGVKNETEASRASRSRSVATISASGRSDFSLSVFPDPPEEPSDGFAAAAALAILKQAGTESKTDPVGEKTEPPQLRLLAPYGDSRRKEVPMNVGSVELTIPSGLRVESGGTQYDVTSFIGDLTSPKHVNSDSITRTLSDVDETSSIITTPSAAILTAQRKPLPIRPFFNPATASGALLASRSPEQEQNQEASPLASSPTTSANSHSGLNARWAGRGGGAPGGLPPRPRLPIGGRHPSPPDGKRVAPDVYERRRPAALVLAESNTTSTTKTTAPPGAF